MAAPRWVENEDEFTLIDEKLDEQPRTDFFRTYLSSDRVFDLTNTNDALGESASAVSFEDGALAPYVDWYLGMVKQVRDDHQARLHA